VDISEALEIAKLIHDYEYALAKVNLMKSGFNDEWVLKNTHTGAEVDLSEIDHEDIKQLFIAKVAAAEQALRKFGIKI